MDISRVKYVVLIRTGIPSLKPHQDKVFYIYKTLIVIATETEQTAENFQRIKPQLNETS